MKGGAGTQMLTQGDAAADTGCCIHMPRSTENAAEPWGRVGGGGTDPPSQARGSHPGYWASSPQSWEVSFLRFEPSIEGTLLERADVRPGVSPTFQGWWLGHSCRRAHWHRYPSLPWGFHAVRSGSEATGWAWGGSGQPGCTLLSGPPGLHRCPWTMALSGAVGSLPAFPLWFSPQCGNAGKV